MKKSRKLRTLVLLLAVVILPLSALFYSRNKDRGAQSSEINEQEISIVSFTDGDTFTAIIPNIEAKIRLYGIDTPESKQAYGKAATTELKRLTIGRTITTKIIDTDRYGRLVAIICADGQNLNRELVKSGYAWVYDQYCKQNFCKDWRADQQTAKAAGKGLWQDSNPVAPWDWRRGKRDK